MAGSDVSSLDMDVEKYAVSNQPFVRHSISGNSLSSLTMSERRSRRFSRTRTHSRNFSRPSPPSSFSDAVENWPKRRRSSDSGPERPPYRRAHTVSPDFASPVSTTSNLPPFAPKTDILREPPPIRPSSPAPTYNSNPKRTLKKAQSMDVLEAARQVLWSSDGFDSGRSLLSQIRDKSGDQPSTFAQRVFEAGKPDLLYELRETKRLKDRRHGVLDLTTLERMNQHVLQQKLVEQVKAIGDKNAWMEIGIKETLHDYCEAVRDMEYMEQCALRGSDNDPFLLTTARSLDCKLLEDAGLAFGDPKKQLRQTAPDRLVYTPRLSFVKRGLWRLLMSLLGGLSLIAPFLIMILVSGQLARIVVTCAFMVAFSVGLTTASELGPDKIALATAAYAGALIVFVGTNPPSFRS